MTNKIFSTDGFFHDRYRCVVDGGEDGMAMSSDTRGEKKMNWKSGQQKCLMLACHMYVSTDAKMSSPTLQTSDCHSLKICPFTNNLQSALFRCAWWPLLPLLTNINNILSAYLLGPGSIFISSGASTKNSWIHNREKTAIYEKQETWGAATCNVPWNRILSACALL